MHITE